MGRKKITTEKGSIPVTVKEEISIKELKPYSQDNLSIAINDLALHIDNAYFRSPFNRCPDCNKGNNSVLAYFGDGATNKIGNLKGFQATIGDIMSWNSPTYKGLSIIKSKSNGIFELETACFDRPCREPAIIERMVVPNMYRPIIGEMATYLTNIDCFKSKKTVKVGEREYPVDIIKKL